MKLSFTIFILVSFIILGIEMFFNEDAETPPCWDGNGFQLTSTTGTAVCIKKHL